MTMSPDSNKPAAKPSGKSEAQSVSGRKTTQEPALKCPRCDSPNTKFCYYNNYSLAQPRHFCKTCRRYWTRGGALRNVPIGGGCRKNKKMKSSPPRLSGDSTDVGGLKLFQGISPAMDFQINFPQNTALLNQFSSFGEFSNAISSGFQGNINHSPGFQELGSLNLHSNLANSIESLSSINQDLHLKLQQQRLSMFFANNQKENSTNLSSVEHFVEKPEPILFQNLDISKTNPCGIGKKDGNLSTEWFFDNSYGNMNPTPATSSNNVNENNNNWSGVQAWSDLAQYTSLP